MTKLSEDLLPIYRLELRLGNEVVRIDEPAGSTCPYAVIFKTPLHKRQLETQLDLARSVEYVESRDPHYPKEAGYVSKLTGHVVAGPLID